MSNSIKLNLHRGQVISIDDPDKLGKVQIQLIPEMVDIKPNKCPWLQSFNGNSSDAEMQNKPPQVGSLVWVLADDLFHYRYYMPFKYDIPGKSDYSKVSDLLDEIGVDSTYKNIVFELYEDQSLSFHDRVEGSHGFIHNTGSYSFFDKDGKLSVLCKSDLDIIAEGETIITSTGAITATSDSDVTIDSKGLVKIDGATGLELNGNSNTLAMDSTGITLTDITGNSSTFSAIGISIKDTNGNEIIQNATGTTIKTGDAVTWQPNILPACLFTGAPHGGVSGGIVKLRGL